jgi:hypothetical protein
LRFRGLSGVALACLEGVHRFPPEKLEATSAHLSPQLLLDTSGAT